MSLRDMLRHSTSAAHEALDHRLSQLDLSAFEDYRAFLAIQAAALLSIEAALDAAGAALHLHDWPDRRRSDALRADLEALREIPARVAFEPIRSTAEIFGTLYVLEGSRLGGTLLHRQAQKSNDPRILSAMRFLAHGAGMKFWQSFVQVLEAKALQGDPPLAADAAIAAAERAFRAFSAAADARLAISNPGETAGKIRAVAQERI